MTDVIFAWSKEGIANAFDAADAPWYKFGVQQTQPMFALMDASMLRWDDPSSGTSLVYYGRQRPIISLGYYLMNGLPIYHALGNATWDATDGAYKYTGLAISNDILPEYHCRYQDTSGINNIIAHQMYCKTHSLNLFIDRQWPMRATELIFGRHRHFNDNSIWADGSTSNNFLTTAMNYPSNLTTQPFYTHTTTTAGFVLDGRSSIIINSNNITAGALSCRMSSSMMPQFNYISGDFFQESIWPNEIIERVPPTPAGIEFDIISGINDTNITDLFDATDFTINAKFLSQDTSHWFEFEATTSNFKESFIAIPDYLRDEAKIQRLRFYCSNTGFKITVKDGLENGDI